MSTCAAPFMCSVTISVPPVMALVPGVTVISVPVLPELAACNLLATALHTAKPHGSAPLHQPSLLEVPDLSAHEAEGPLSPS